MNSSIDTQKENYYPMDLLSSMCHNDRSLCRYNTLTTDDNSIAQFFKQQLQQCISYLEVENLNSLWGHFTWSSFF